MEPRSSSGRLVVVATPIGNLGDLSPRAAATLRSADLVAAEDTRRTGRLLAHVGSDTRQLSYHEHNEEARTPELVERMAQGEVVALVVDAGTPGVSDPGFRLVRACVEAGIEVEVVPGPSAALAALVVSGLPADRFAFEGFLPRRGAARRRHLDELARERRTMVVFLSPHRAADELRELAAALGPQREAALCRELTKLHEEVVRASLGELAARAERDALRGELALVVAGLGTPAAAVPSVTELAREVERRVGDGMSRRDAIASVAEDLGIPRRAVYQAVVDAGGS